MPLNQQQMDDLFRNHMHNQGRGDNGLPTRYVDDATYTIYSYTDEEIQQKMRQLKNG